MAEMVEAVLKMYKQIQAEHQNWCGTWQELADYEHPVRSEFSPRMSGAKKTEKLFDSTALEARDRLSASIIGTLMSRQIKWFKLRYRLEELNNDREAAMWAEDAGHRMLKAFGQSNLYSEAHEVFDSLAAFGTGPLFVEERPFRGEGFEGFQFQALPLAYAYIDEDAEHRVDTLFRTFSLSAQAAIRHWGIENLGEKVQKAWQDGDDQTQFEFLHAVYPREPKGARRKEVPLVKGDLPWVSFFIGMADENIVEEGGYHEFPFMVPRWRKNAGERYGTGPGHIALPDVKTLNEAKKIGMQMWAKRLDPPVKYRDDGVLAEPINVPGGMTPCRDPEKDILPLYGPEFWVGTDRMNEISVEDLRNSIRRVFFADKLELPMGPQMTAFEVAKRFELLQRLLGPTMGRIETEFLNPLIERCFRIMLRRKAFDEVPLILEEYGADIDIEYEGPLAKSQRLAEVEGLERLHQLLAPVAELKPEIMDIIDLDKMVRGAGDVLGVPEKMMRSERDVAAMREQREAEQQEAKQAEDMEREAAAIGKIAPALGMVQGRGGEGGQA